MRVGVLIALTACQADVVPTGRTGSGHDGCTSVSDHLLYADVHEVVVTEYLHDGALLTESIERYEGNERVSSTFLENGYLDGVLASKQVTQQVHNEQTFTIEVYGYDAEGRLSDTETSMNGTRYLTARLAYDEHGHLVQRAVQFGAEDEGAIDQLTTWAWTDHRLQRVETRLDGSQGTPYSFEDHTYAEPPPSLDVHIDIGGAYVTDPYQVERSYHGDQLIHQAVLDHGATRYTSTHHTYTPEGWLASTRVSVSYPDSYGLSDALTSEVLTLHTYDDAGHLLHTITGEDFDADGQIDGHASEQTWEWSCP